MEPRNSSVKYCCALHNDGAGLLLGRGNYYLKRTAECSPASCVALDFGNCWHARIKNHNNICTQQTLEYIYKYPYLDRELTWSNINMWCYAGLFFLSIFSYINFSNLLNIFACKYTIVLDKNLMTQVSVKKVQKPVI